MLFVLLGGVYDDRFTSTLRELLRGVLGYAVANTAFAGLAIMLVIRREAGS